jgi:hypothetical protein
MKTTKRIPLTTLAALLSLLPALTRAETAVQAWVQRYRGPGDLYSSACAIALDASNNVIVAGTGATIKYSSAGVPLWTNYSSGAAIAVDRSNNVIVTGFSSGNIGRYDYATIQYSSAGMPLWTNRYERSGSDCYAYDVAVDDTNNVIVTGGPVTIKYSSAGVPLWTNVGAEAVAVDGSNNVIVTGAAGWPNSDYFTVKYSSDGVLLWTNRYNGPGNGEDYAYDVAVDGSNNVIVTGHSAKTYVYPYNFDYTTIKYSTGGVPLWTNRYNGPGNGEDDAYAVAVDGRNNVIVTGHSDVNGYGTNYGYATIKYSSAGVPLWTNRYNGPGNGYGSAYAVAVDSSGSVIVTGESPGSGGNVDFATIKYICVPSPLMTNLSGSNGTFQMRVDDVLQPGTLVIEASTNLTGWAAIFTNTTPTNVLFYTDPAAGSHLWRFYRAFQFP